MMTYSVIDIRMMLSRQITQTQTQTQTTNGITDSQPSFMIGMFYIPLATTTFTYTVHTAVKSAMVLAHTCICPTMKHSV